MDASFIDEKLLRAFGLSAAEFKIQVFGSGLINQTWKLTGQTQSYILQQLNRQVFKAPETIAQNLEKLNLYLLKTAPEYLFTAPLPNLQGRFLVWNDAGDCFRLFRFVSGSHSVDTVNHPKQAYEAAKQFGKFSRLLHHFNPQELQTTIPDFHNLRLRYNQFDQAHHQAKPDLKKMASGQIAAVLENADILQTYQKMILENQLPLRVMHHDTKISNVLFDDQGNGLCVVDLDTVMPGYFLSDLGDMLRTYLSPASEEETDLDRIIIRPEYYRAVISGYLSEIEPVLSSAEKQCFFYAGKMMIYMQAIRFLTDFLNGDVYYPVTYLAQNLFRATNQLTLLKRFGQMENQLAVL